MDANGAFQLSNLMEVWGDATGLQEQEVLNALRRNMFHGDSYTLRFAITTDEVGHIMIRVPPKRARSRSRSPRGGVRVEVADADKHKRADAVARPVPRTGVYPRAGYVPAPTANIFDSRAAKVTAAEALVTEAVAGSLSRDERRARRSGLYGKLPPAPHPLDMPLPPAPPRRPIAQQPPPVSIPVQLPRASPKHKPCGPIVKLNLSLEEIIVKDEEMVD